MSAAWAKPSARARWSAALGANGASGSAPSIRSFRRYRSPCGPSTTGPYSSERTSSQPRWGCSRSAGSRRGRRDSIFSSGIRRGSLDSVEHARVSRLDLLERHPSRLVEQVDQPEVPQREYDHLLAADVLLRLLLRLRRLPPGRLLHGAADRALVLVAVLDVCHRRVFQGALHEFVEAVAVALLEGRALRLAVVRED